jgi:hypothetical protein
MRLVLGRPTSRTTEERLNLVTEAVFRLAEQNVGALVVFQNRDRLAELVRDGIVLNGQISVPILETIFSKESPVHDGAVVIRGQRIDRVGTILPLTRRADLPSQYGTRHRAAIGLSDACDAYVLVVSEERGEVSVVHRGQVKLVRHRTELEEILRHHFGYDQTAQRARVLRRELLRQAGGFLLTTAAVAAYWAVFYGQEVSLSTVTSAVDFQNVPEGLEMTWASYKHIDIQIQGQRPLIEDLKLHPEQVSVLVSLEGARPGHSQTITIEPKDIRLPVGLEVFRISPNNIMIDLERRVSRRVPIRVKFAQPPPEDAEVFVEPDAILIVGPETAVSALKFVDTAPIAMPRLSAQRPEALVTAPLSAPADTVRPAEDEPEKARVRIRLGREAKRPSNSRENGGAEEAPGTP